MTRTRKGALHLLSTREVMNAGAGLHADGGGLALSVDGGSATWVFRYTSPTGRRREMGLGVAYRGNPTVAGAGLTSARRVAQEAREQLRAGIDPIEARKKQRSDARAAEDARKAEKSKERATLARVARDYHERVIEPNRTTKHGAQWIASLENHVPPGLWQKPIAEVTAPELLDFVAGLQRAIPETAKRVRQRLEAIFDDAEFRGLCQGNPARAIRRKLREVGGARPRGQFAALPYAELPAFMARLKAMEGTAARCLELAILTAARTGEAIGAEWSEFDLEAGVWTVPAGRMKAGEPHVVPLSPAALAVLQRQQGLDARFVFPSPTIADQPISNMAMLLVLRRMRVADRTTVHGMCRASFSTWAYETAAARPDVIEAALAHREGDRVKAAYNRAQFAAERRALLLAWAEYLGGAAVPEKVERRAESPVMAYAA